MIKVLGVILILSIIVILIGAIIDYIVFKSKYLQLVLTGIEDLKESFNKNNINEE